MEEQFNVVDKDDNYTGKLTTKAQAHREGLPHRVSAVLVFQNDKLLLQVHESSDGLLDHTVGGHVSAGETYVAAALREMKEEINLIIPIEEVSLSVFADEIWRGLRVTHLFGVFKAFAPKEWVFQPNEEVKALVSLNYEEILQQMREDATRFTGGFIATYNAYLKSQGLPNAQILEAAKVKGVTI